MNTTVLITGASGVIGGPLTVLLLEKGYKVRHLSRSPKAINPAVEVFVWDVYNGKIDARCLDGTDVIIHLAGEGIADKRWSDKRKKQLIESRTKSIELIYDTLQSSPNQVKTILSAAAIGIYGDRGDELLTEESAPGSGFMPHTCIEWEKSVDKGAQLGFRIVKFRTGVVLAAKDGALPQLAAPIKYGFGAALGSGKQWVPWIHIADAVNMYLFALERENFTGVYNMVAPNPVTNAEMTRDIAAILQKPLWLPKVPAFALKLLLGEMSTIVLGSTRVSSTKIEQEHFRFEFPALPATLQDLYKKA